MGLWDHTTRGLLQAGGGVREGFSKEVTPVLRPAGSEGASHREGAALGTGKSDGKS